MSKARNERKAVPEGRPAIELRQLGVRLAGKDILTDLNTTLCGTDFTIIIGRNGSGKSTLLRSILSLVPYTGELLWNGESLATLSRTERARRLSYLPQQRPIPYMSVETLIAHGRFPHLGFAKTLGPGDREKIAAAARLAGVTSLLTRPLQSLSGGERQRVYIAMMVAQDADMLLLDEPTTFLDIPFQLEVLELLRKLHQQGKGIVMVAHDLEQAFTYATRVILLHDGRILASGPPAEIAGSAVIKEVFGVSLEPSPAPADLFAYRLVH